MSALPLLLAATAAAVVYGRNPVPKPKSDPTAGAVVSDEVPVDEPTSNTQENMAIGVPEPSYTAVVFASPSDAAQAKSHLRSGLYPAVPTETGDEPRTSTLPLAPVAIEGYPILLGRRFGTRE